MFPVKPIYQQKKVALLGKFNPAVNQLGRLGPRDFFLGCIRKIAFSRANPSTGFRLRCAFGALAAVKQHWNKNVDGLPLRRCIIMDYGRGETA